MRRRIVVVLALVAVTVVLALTPAFAKGGCQAFGVQGANLATAAAAYIRRASGKKYLRASVDPSACRASV